MRVSSRSLCWVLVLTLVNASGCAGWRTVSREDLSREVRGYRPSKVRVFQADSVLEVRDPSIRADSLVGKRDRTRAPVTLSLAAVDSAAVQGNTRSRALWVGVPIVVFMAAWVIVMLPDPVSLPEY